MSKVLIIDDDDLFRGLLEAAFGNDGHEVLIAEDGEHGVASAKVSLPDIIITDMNMPRMTGWQVLDALKADAATESIPVVVLSAQRTSQDIDEAHMRGCAAYLVKPIDILDMMAKVRGILGS